MKRSLASTLLLAGAGAGCGAVDGVKPPINATSAATVAEGGTLALTGTLVTADPDTKAESLVYTVVSLPENGALMADGVAVAAGDTFTQADVTAGKVSYVNDGAEKTSDSFTWTLSDGPNEIGPLPFAITITPVNDAPMVVNNVLSTVLEGGEAMLTADQLSVTDAETATPTSLTFTVVAITHGGLAMKNAGGTFDAIAAGATFTQQDIADGNIKFVDSGVDDASLAAGQSSLATFSWRVADPDGGVTPSATTEDVTSFTVMPVDDPAVSAFAPSRCYTPNTAINANPVTSLSDPDNPNSSYQICIVSIGNGTQINSVTGQTIGVTVSATPTIKNGTTVLAVSSCVQADSLAGLTFTNNMSDYGGDVTWVLKHAGVVVGTNHSMTFPRCP